MTRQFLKEHSMQRRTLYWMAGLMALVMLALTGCEAPEAERSRKVSPDWSRGVRLGVAYFGEPITLVADEGRGGSHIVWTGQKEGEQNLHYLRLSPQAEVLLERDLETPLSRPRRPQLLLDKDGRLHLLFLARPPGSEMLSLFHALLGDEGQIAAGPARLSALDQGVELYRAVLNAAGQIAVFWSVEHGADPGIRYVRLDEEGSPTSSPNLLVAGGTAFDVQVDAGGTLHLTWFQPWANDQGQEVRYASFTDARIEPVTGVRLTDMPTPRGVIIWGPTLGLDTTNAYVFWSREYRLGLEAGTAETHYTTFLLGAPVPGEKPLLLPPVSEPVYDEHEGPFGYANLAYLASELRYDSGYLTMPVPVAGQMSELPVLVTMKVFEPGRAKAQVMVAVFAQGKLLGYQFLAQTTLFSQYPLAVSDAAHDLHTIWSDLAGRGRHIVYFASTSSAVKDRIDRFGPNDVATSGLNMLWGILSGFVVLPLTLLWILPAVIWLAIYTFLGRGEDLTYRPARIALAVGVLLYLGSKFVWMPTILDYIPFSAWVPLPLQSISLLLRLLTPAIILALACLAGYARVRRADTRSVFSFMVPFVLVDALLTIAIYGPSIVPQG